MKQQEILKYEALILILGALGVAPHLSACGDNSEPETADPATTSGGTNGQGDGDGNGDGDGDSDSNGDGDSLDQSPLSENCAGMQPSQGEECNEEGLVCHDDGGATCVCGEFPSDDSGGFGDGDGFGDGFPGFPGDDEPFEAQWECYVVGSPTIGTGGDDGLGGSDGSGGDPSGGQGGSFLSL